MLFKLCMVGLNVFTHINSGLQLMQRNPATVAEHLSADVLADRGGAWDSRLKTLSGKKPKLCFSDHQRSLSCRTLTIQVQQHVGLEQVFGPSHLTLRHTGAKRHPDGGEQRHLSAHRIPSHEQVFEFEGVCTHHSIWVKCIMSLIVPGSHTM